MPHNVDASSLQPRTCHIAERRRLRGLTLTQIVPNGSENKASEHAHMPQKAQGPEGVISSRALREIGEVCVHGGEERLGEPCAVGERNMCGHAGRDDPPDEREDDYNGVEIIVDAVRNFEFHTRSRASHRQRSRNTCSDKGRDRNCLTTRWLHTHGG